MLALLRRRSLLIFLTAVTVAALAYLVAGLRPVTFSADSVLLVPSGGSGTGPGQANEALRLAFTYAELIPRDADVQQVVATALQEPVTNVRARLSVQPLGDTALLRVRYTSPNRAQALVGSRTAAQSVVEGIATSDTVARGSVRLVGLAEDDSVIVSGGVTPATVPIGLVLGLALGVVLALAAERANRRVDRPEDVRAVLDVPVFELDRATPARREALLRLWREHGSGSGPTVVSVTGADISYDSVVRTCATLSQGLDGARVAAPGDAHPPGEGYGDRIVLVPTGAPGSGEPYEEVAMSADLVVLIVPLAVRRAVVESIVSDLMTYGSRPPAFVLVTAGPGRAPQSRRAVRDDAALTQRGDVDQKAWPTVS